MKIWHMTYGRRGQEHRGVERIIGKINEYAPPGTELTQTEAYADLVIFHVTGRHDHVLADTRRVRANGQRYAICQYSLASTRNPNPRDWIEIWEHASPLWSYYDLRGYAEMYLAPLGADPNIFHPVEAAKDYLIGTLGIAYKDECVGECQIAAHTLRGRSVHVGPNFNSNPMVDYLSDISDSDLCLTYNRCRWFGVLRRGDGFEMPAVEAILCGVRPIMFDKPNFRLWYAGTAEFIPEGDPASVVQDLVRVLKADRPITDAEIADARRRFDWEMIMKGLWSNIWPPGERGS
jgi:hypothetical protein